jgi:1-aminocyclopropane-1-carboxylate deaminase
VPYGILAGASEHPLRGLDFANWAFEVREQERQLGVFFDDHRLHRDRLHPCRHDRRLRRPGRADPGSPPRVSGIDASATIEKNRDQVARIARNTGKLIELGQDLTDDEIPPRGLAGDFYGIPVESTIEAIRLSGSLEAMIIDPVYEGRPMAGLIDLVSSGEIPKDSTVLYAHLGVNRPSTPTGASSTETAASVHVAGHRSAVRVSGRTTAAAAAVGRAPRGTAVAVVVVGPCE